jgi:hypothetical protein
MENTSSSELHFSVDSHLLLELGERLVARRSIALAELAKNAYDADSPDVVITLDKVTKTGGTIVVEDHGEGMTYDMLVKGWMRIATGDKRENPVSRKYERLRTGAKGIGRFACRVLSNRLLLESVAVVGSGRKEKVSATFDWRDFKPGSSVGEIGISCIRQLVDYSTDTGTKITLEDTRGIWEEDDLNQLRNDLLSLVSDYTPEMQVADTEKKPKDPGFQVIIRAPDFPEFQGRIVEQFLRYSWCRLIGRISSDGKPRYQLRVRRLKKDLQYSPERTFAEVGETYFRIDFFVYRREYFAGFPISLNEARNLGNIFANIAFFRGFSAGEANHLLQIVDDLTYRGMCVLALVGRKDELPIGQLREESYSERKGTVLYETISILQEIYRIYNWGLVACRQKSGEGYVAILDWTDVAPNRLLLTSVGQRYHHLMGLEEIPEEDIAEVAKYLR